MSNPIPQIKVAVNFDGKTVEKVFKPAEMPLTDEDLDSAKAEVVDAAVDFIYEFYPEQYDDPALPVDLGRAEE